MPCHMSLASHNPQRRNAVKQCHQVVSHFACSQVEQMATRLMRVVPQSEVQNQQGSHTAFANLVNFYAALRKVQLDAELDRDVELVWALLHPKAATVEDLTTVLTRLAGDQLGPILAGYSSSGTAAGRIIQQMASDMLEARDAEQTVQGFIKDAKVELANMKSQDVSAEARLGHLAGARKKLAKA